MRRGQERGRAERRATRGRTTAIEDAQVHGGYEAPPRSECTAREFYQHLDDDGRTRVTFLIWSTDRGVVDFHLVSEILVLSGLEWVWRPVVRVDICHGHAHAHALIGSKVDSVPLHIARIEDSADVQAAMRKSIAMIVPFSRKVRGEGGEEDA